MRFLGDLNNYYFSLVMKMKALLEWVQKNIEDEERVAIHLRKSLEEFYYKGEQSNRIVSEQECVRVFCFLMKLL